jgi:sulfur relay (sulfurtransferase) DsrC/TusE family protein
MRGMRGCNRARLRLAWLAGGMCAWLSLSAPAPSLADEQGQSGSAMEQVMKLLAQRKHGEVNYVEEDYFAILDRPVKSSGVLVYEAPDHLEKRTLKPKRESLTLEGDELTVERKHRTYHMQLSAYPQVALLVDAIRDTLGGNEEALRKVFKVGFTGTLADWTLKLAPLKPDLARKVERVEIAGARDEIHSVEIFQVGGDHSVLTSSPSQD